MKRRKRVWLAVCASVGIVGILFFSIVFSVYFSTSPKVPDADGARALLEGAAKAEMPEGFEVAEVWGGVTPAATNVWMKVNVGDSESFSGIIEKLGARELKGSDLESARERLSGFEVSPRIVFKLQNANEIIFFWRNGADWMVLVTK